MTKTEAHDIQKLDFQTVGSGSPMRELYGEDRHTKTASLSHRVSPRKTGRTSSVVHDQKGKGGVISISRNSSLSIISHCSRSSRGSDEMMVEMPEPVLYRE